MDRKDTSKQVAWDMFKRTGKIGHYMFFKSIEEDRENK